MPAPETSDLHKMIFDMLSKKYGDYVLHMLHCRTTDEAVAALRHLSFISGDSLESLSTPANIQPFVIKEEKGAWVQALVGGQLTKDQNSEVRRVAKELGISCESLCCAHKGSLTEREFLQADSYPQETSPAPTKKWWQIRK